MVQWCGVGGGETQTLGPTALWRCVILVSFSLWGRSPGQDRLEGQLSWLVRERGGQRSGRWGAPAAEPWVGALGHCIPPPQARAQRGGELAEQPGGASWGGVTGSECKTGLMAVPATQEPEKPLEIKFSPLTGKRKLREGEELAESHSVAELGLYLGLEIRSLLDIEPLGQEASSDIATLLLHPACTWPVASAYQGFYHSRSLGEGHLHPWRWGRTVQSHGNDQELVI